MRKALLDGVASAPPLSELDREEYRAATRTLWPPDYTDEDFDRDWAEFAEIKRKREMN